MVNCIFIRLKKYFSQSFERLTGYRSLGRQFVFQQFRDIVSCVFEPSLCIMRSLLTCFFPHWHNTYIFFPLGTLWFFIYDFFFRNLITMYLFVSFFIYFCLRFTEMPVCGFKVFNQIFQWPLFLQIFFHPLFSHFIFLLEVQLRMIYHFISHYIWNRTLIFQISSF